MDYLIPVFEKSHNADVQVIAVGTGEALKLGQQGDADALLVHDRTREDTFMADGDGSLRYDVMFNDFIIVGPAADPAGIKGMSNPSEALTIIAESQSAFVSRGDDSGTHSREKALWKAAGIEPSGDWYLSAGQGMGEVLTLSDEKGAYTLSDRATYLARVETGLSLVVLVEGDPSLLNHYGVIVVNPDKHPGVNSALAQEFADWLTSIETQQLILDFHIGGKSVFTPESEAWKASGK